MHRTATHARRGRIILTTFGFIQSFSSGGIFFGWPSLVVVLKKSNLFNTCDNIDGDIGDSEGNSDGGECVAQDVAFANIYTTASSCHFAGFFIFGSILDKYGPRMCSVAGIFCVTVGTLLLAFTSENSDYYLLPAYSLLAFGAPGIHLSWLHLSKLFTYGKLIRTIMVSALISGGVTYPIFSYLLLVGVVSWRTLFLAHGAWLALLTWLAFQVWPSRTFTEDDAIFFHANSSSRRALWDSTREAVELLRREANGHAEEQEQEKEHNKGHTSASASTSTSKLNPEEDEEAPSYLSYLHPPSPERVDRQGVKSQGTSIDISDSSSDGNIGDGLSASRGVSRGVGGRVGTDSHPHRFHHRFQSWWCLPVLRYTVLRVDAKIEHLHYHHHQQQEQLQQQVAEQPTASAGQSYRCLLPPSKSKSKSKSKSTDRAEIAGNTNLNMDPTLSPPPPPPLPPLPLLPNLPLPLPLASDLPLGQDIGQGIGHSVANESKRSSICICSSSCTNKRDKDKHIVNDDKHNGNEYALQDGLSQSLNLSIEAKSDENGAKVHAKASANLRDKNIEDGDSAYEGSANASVASGSGASGSDDSGGGSGNTSGGGDGRSSGYSGVNMGGGGGNAGGVSFLSAREVFWGTTFMMCVHLLRFSFIVGSANAQLQAIASNTNKDKDSDSDNGGNNNGGDGGDGDSGGSGSDEGSEYAQLLSLILPLSALALPFFGLAIERWGFAWGYAVCLCLGTAYGLLLLVPSLPLQLLTFICLGLHRVSLFATMFALAGAVYSSKHFGRLSGGAMLLAAVFSLLQYGLTVAVERGTGGDYFVVNLALALLSLPTFYFPYYIHRKKECQIAR